MVGLKLMFEILGFTSFFFGVTSKKQNNSTLIGFLDKTMELKWWNTTKNQGFLLVFSWFENPRKKLLKSMGRNTTQARLENTIRTQVSACTLKTAFKANILHIGLVQDSFKEYDIPWIKSHHSLHKVTSFCIVLLYKGVQHFFVRNMELFSKRLTAEQSYKKKCKISRRNMQLFSQRRTAVQSSKEMRHFLKRTSSYFQWDLQVCKVIKECSFLWKEHKVIFNETYTCAKLWRSAAFFERDIELFSIRLRAVQSSVKEVYNWFQEGW